MKSTLQHQCEQLAAERYPLHMPGHKRRQAPAPGLGYALPARNYDILTSVRRPFVFFYGFSILHESFLIRHILPHDVHEKSL